MRKLLRLAGPTLAVLLVTSTVARADYTVDVGSVSTGITSNITYATSASASSTEDVYVGPFTNSSTNPSTPILNGDLFCVDLWHNQNQNVSNSSTLGDATGLASTVPPGVTSASNLVNNLNYLGYVFNALDQGLSGTAQSYALAALQLAIWNQVANGPHAFSFDNNNGTLNTDYSSINSLLAGNAATIAGVSLLGIGSLGTNGYTAEVFYVDRANGYTGQNLMTWSPVAAAPEPSTMAIAGLGALGFVAYGLRRRKAAR